MPKNRWKKFLGVGVSSKIITKPKVSHWISKIIGKEKNLIPFIILTAELTEIKTAI